MNDYIICPNCDTENEIDSSVSDYDFCSECGEMIEFDGEES